MNWARGTGETMKAPQELAVLDRDHLRAMTGGDGELAVEVIGIFRQQAEVWGRMLSARQPDEVWADAAHSLKGAALGIGAIKLASLCSRAEKLGRSGTASSVQAAVALDEVRSGLGEALEAGAVLAHELAGSAGFIASKDSNS